MNTEKATDIVKKTIAKVTEHQLAITEDMQLVGREAVLDSMKLVEVCLALEDFADDTGFEFDWTSEAAMSKSRGMFRTVAALAEELLRQWEQTQ
ncbi:MAG: hypothetical protein ACR2OA_08310 [Rubripirellula sp.]